MIVFSKGCHDWVTLRSIGPDGVGVGHEFNLAEAAQQLPNVAVQGNFDPELLVHRDAERDRVGSDALAEIDARCAMDLFLTSATVFRRKLKWRTWKPSWRR